MDGKFFQKIFQKSLKFFSKMDPNWSQNDQKIDPRRHPKNDLSQEASRRLHTAFGLGILGRLGGVLGRLGREKWPTWLQLGSQNGAKMVQKSIKIWIIFWMPLGIDFLMIFDRFFIQNGGKLRPKIDQKSMSTSKGDFLKNRALPAAGARFFKIRGSKLGAKIDQKSVQK